MIGKVEFDEALLEVEFVDLLERINLKLEFVVDTGFKGHLTLPPDAVEALLLPEQRAIEAKLADDSVIEVKLHAAKIRWHGSVLEVGVLATGKRPLLGTQLLANHDLYIRFRNGGEVRIEQVEPLGQ